MGVFLRHGRVCEIARNHHEIWARLEIIQRCDATLQRSGRVNLSVSKRSGRLDMQVGNLRDEEWLLRHLSGFSFPTAAI